MENDPNEYTGPTPRNAFSHPHVKGAESPHKIRHGEILAKATGLSQKEIWDGLMDFILFGKPKTYGTPIYELYFCWQAILTLQNREMDVGEWGDPESIVADVLGWSSEHVTKALFSGTHLVVKPSNDAKLARSVHHTIVLFIEESIRLQELINRENPEAKHWTELFGQKWYWYATLKQPVYVVKIYPDETSIGRAHGETLADILVKANMGWEQLTDGAGPDLIPAGKHPQYTTVFELRTVSFKDLSNFRLETDELEY